MAVHVLVLFIYLFFFLSNALWGLCPLCVYSHNKFTFREIVAHSPYDMSSLYQLVSFVFRVILSGHCFISLVLSCMLVRKMSDINNAIS